MQNQPVQIENSRTKLAGIFIGALLFVSAGVWFALKPYDVVIPMFKELFMIRIIGIISIALFGTIGIFILKKLADKKPALIISDEGFTDRSGAASIGFISWAGVIAISEITIAGQKLIGVDLKDPEHYIGLQTNVVKSKLLQANYKQYGLLVSLSANSLQCSHHQLKVLLNNSFNFYKAIKVTGAV
jgi:hypothetical protein